MAAPGTRRGRRRGPRRAAPALRGHRPQPRGRRRAGTPARARRRGRALGRRVDARRAALPRGPRPVRERPARGDLPGGRRRPPPPPAPVARRAVPAGARGAHRPGALHRGRAARVHDRPGGEAAAGRGVRRRAGPVRGQRLLRRGAPGRRPGLGQPALDADRGAPHPARTAGPRGAAGAAHRVGRRTPGERGAAARRGRPLGRARRGRRAARGRDPAGPRGVRRPPGVPPRPAGRGPVRRPAARRALVGAPRLPRGDRAGRTRRHADRQRRRARAPRLRGPRPARRAVRVP